MRRCEQILEREDEDAFDFWRRGDRLRSISWQCPMKGAGKIGASIAVLVLAGATTNPGYAQDAEHGKTIFEACAACHATDHANRIGPGLGGIIGRKAGTVPGFPYSDAMKKSDVVWDAKILDAYVESPQKVVPGNRMPYAGLKNPTDRMDLLAYLATLK